MVKKVPRKTIGATDYKQFYYLSGKFHDGAVLAMENENYNSAGVLIIHAAIACADAITIKLSSCKSSGDNHYEVIKLLQESVPDSAAAKSALLHFEKLIDHKNAVSYQGKLFMKSDIDMLLKHYTRFAACGKSVL
jgi:hypothetical protein